MRNLTLLGARLVLGGYLAVHGAQKLFGAFGGHGLEATGAGFETLGLRPGKPMAALAGATELGGGLLTAAGIADPAGPLAIMGVMAVATATHRKNGPLASKGGFELPLTNLATAAVLAAAGAGRYRLGPRLPCRLVIIMAAGEAVLVSGSLVRLLASSSWTTARITAARPPSPG